MHFSARNLILALAGSLAMAMAAALAADATPDAKEILALSGVRYGLCVHLGCGRAESPGLTAALAENSTLVVHGLAGDEAALARARKEIEARNVCGRAMVERIPLNPLPYLSDMANLAVVEDLAALGISKEEILRIVAPNGVLCIREAGKWAKTVKPRPKEMDDWSHPFHGADGNMVSADKLIKFPLGFRWIDGLPVNINAWAACRAWIVAGGRVYTLSSNELENLENHSKKHFLSARDAFSGIPLWKMNVETTDDGAHLTWRNTGALVADEQRVYAVQSTKPIVVEGATGKLIATCDTKYTPHRLAVLNGVLLAACWEAHHSANDAVEGASLWATWLPTMDAETKSTRGTIEAFEAASGKPKWSAPLAAYMLLAADDTVYALTHSGVSKSDSDFEKELASAVEKELQQELANPPAKEQPAEPAKELAAEPAKEPAKELAALPATEPAKDQRLENKMFRLVNIPPDGPKNSECWASLVEELKKAKSPIGTISFEKRSNTIAARDTPEALEKIEQAVKKVDIPPQQALAKELAKKLAQDYGKDSGKDAAKEQPWKNAWKKLTEARRTQLRAAGRNEWERQVVALDLQTGQEKWRLHHGKLGSRADLELGCAGPGYLVVYKRDERGFSVLSAKDGSVLWQTKGGGTWTPVVDGLLWQGRKRFDPLTGAVKGDWPVDPGDQGCTPSNVVDNIVTRTRGCGYEQVVQEEGKPPRTQGVQYTGARGGCMEGMVPANGMFYTAQNNCRCSPGQIYGFLAVGPVGADPAAADFEKPRPIEKGPAFGTPDEGTNAASDWTTFRHDAERSAGTNVKLPDQLKELWKSPAALPADGPLAAAWKARLASCLSAPVSAGGMVFAAATDAGQIVALDAATGKKAWSTALGGRVDSPPTLYRGLCLAGSHDGWVYALRAKDGQLAWRARVAPSERRLVAYGEVEAVWPAVGTVLVHDNVAYVNAGRTCESDGGIAVVAFDPLTGSQIWGKAIGKGPQRQNDMLYMRDGLVGWYHVRLDPKTGEAKPSASVPNDYSQGGMLDGTWTLVGKRRSGNAFGIGKPADTKNHEQTAVDLLAWNETLFATSAFTLASEKANATTGRVKSQDYGWKPTLPNGAQVEALALAGNAVVYAGRIKDSQTTKPLGFLLIASAADGKTIAEFSLETPPVYDGLAVAGEKVYVALQNGNIVCYGK